MPAFSLAAFLAASLDWLNTHPLGFGLLLGAAALAVWTCAVGISRAGLAGAPGRT